MSTTRLTASEYWEAGYADRAVAAPLEIGDYRCFAERKLIEKLESIGLPGRKVLEVGAGNSTILSYLGRTYRGRAEFSGLDYSESGCRLLAARAEREGASIEVLHQDLFEPSAALLGRFDVVFSIGVVEHFTSLPEVLRAMSRLLAPGGRMFTLIPNMAGILGALTRRYNPRVFGLHVPHTLDSFRQGHDAAGLAVESSGYLCSTNFGVLSACFTGEADRGWTTYKWLSRLTKFLWLVESRLGELPHTGRFSPYLYAISFASR